MATLDQVGLSPEQQAMVEVWEQHTRCEFTTHCLADTMETMTDDPCVLHVPVMTGGFGREAVERFYGEQFIPNQPPDTEIVLISRTVGRDTIVDELIHKFTHTIKMPWILPGVAPTGRRVELPVAAFVRFEGGKIASEHIYWDQASLLAQIGVLEEGTMPIQGRQAARRLQNEPLATNQLIERSTN